MSLFSLDNILLNESNNNSIDIDDIGYMDTELNNQSFVQEGYDFILEMGRDYMNAEKTFYTNILGSYGDNEIITESFSSFFDKIKAVIKKFIDWIKKIFKEFVLKLNSLVSNEKYLKKNHTLLNKFDSQDEFEFNGYEFTNINNSDIPVATALSAFDNDDNGKGYLSSSNWYDSNNLSIADTDVDGRKGQTTKLNTALDNKLEVLNNGLEDFYDIFRGRVIGKSDGTKIDSNDFAEELFEVFRNGESIPSDITIDATFVSEAYRRFDNHKETIKAIEKNQKEIIKDYEALEKYLDKMIKLNKADTKNMKLSVSDRSSIDYVANQIDVLSGTATGVSDLNDKLVYDTSTFDKMNNYLKVQSSKVNQMCSIHTQAFTAKLEAAKDQFKQDKKILYKALQKIVKRSNKPGY